MTEKKPATYTSVVVYLHELDCIQWTQTHGKLCV